MSYFGDRAKRYHAAIREILLNDWDPIGVADVAEAQDEYDSYVGGVYSRLIRRSGEQAIFTYLWEIETSHMGLVGNRAHTQHIADELVNLVARLDSGNSEGTK